MKRGIVGLTEKIIKCKTRVQKHGEVFTPKRIVNQMLDYPEIKEECESLTATFLEPTAGEGGFLVAILERKLNMVSKRYNENLDQYENFSLLVLTTLYGIELLEDNAQTCVINIYQKFYDCYKEQVQYHNGKMNHKVLESAKKIISLNIGNGDFLTRLAINGQPLVFSEWEPISLRRTSKNIMIQRTEYTLEEIYENARKKRGKILKNIPKQPEQLDIFSFLNEYTKDQEEQKVEFKYTPVKIIDIYKEEMEKVKWTEQ